MTGDFSISIGERPLEPQIPPRPSYAARIERAESLLQRFPASAELLRFYAGVAAAQQNVFQTLKGTPAPDYNWTLSLDTVVPLFPAFANAIAQVAPSSMREGLSSLNESDVPRLLADFWNGQSPQEPGQSILSDSCIALAFLQPYAESLAENGAPNSSVTRHATCPICSSEPLCAVLRDKDHGASRGLVCSLCMKEWSFPRVLCPSCGESRFEQLPVLTPEDDPHVRIDACDTCKHYIKTVDFTKDGLAVAVVDELATASLDLWAREQGYAKLMWNLVGL